MCLEFCSLSFRRDEFLFADEERREGITTEGRRGDQNLRSKIADQNLRSKSPPCLAKNARQGGAPALIIPL